MTDIPKPLADLIGRRVQSLAGISGNVTDVAFYQSPAGDAHGAGWHVTVVNEFGHTTQNDLATFNAIWTVVK